MEPTQASCVFPEENNTLPTAPTAPRGELRNCCTCGGGSDFNGQRPTTWLGAAETSCRLKTESFGIRGTYIGHLIYYT